MDIAHERHIEARGVIRRRIVLPRRLQGAHRVATYFRPDADPAEVAALIREFGWPAIYATRIEPLLVAAAGRG